MNTIQTKTSKIDLICSKYVKMSFYYHCYVNDRIKGNVFGVGEREKREKREKLMVAAAIYKNSLVFIFMVLQKCSF